MEGIDGPALLISMSSLPPVSASTSFFRAAMLPGESTSTASGVMPRAFRSWIESVRLAVARTWYPLALNSRARAWPMPLEVPVMRTVFFEDDIAVNYLCYLEHR